MKNKQITSNMKLQMKWVNLFAVTLGYIYNYDYIYIVM